MGRKRRKAPPKKPLLDPELPVHLESMGFNRKHATRIWHYLFAHPEVEDLRGLPELPKSLREILQDQYCTCTSIARREFRSSDGTIKILVRLHDGYEVESVIINQGGEGEFSGVQRQRMKHGATLCVSSQVGCRMACKFCATGTLGLDGDLASHEILEQLLLARRARSDIKHIVFMGMGEPLDNFDAVVAAVRLMTSDAPTFGLGARPITVSTVSPTPRAIGKLIDAGLAGHARLAVSLHAPSQHLREEIVPTANGNPLTDLMAQIDAYYETARHVSRKARVEKICIEYCLLDGVNDTEECAIELGKLLEPRANYLLVNLIPYNSVQGAPYGAPSADAVQRFHEVVTDHGVQSHVRRQLGDDIAAACGQLARDEREQADIEEASASHRCSSSAVAAATSAAVYATEGSLHFQMAWVCGTVICLGLVTLLAFRVVQPRRNCVAL
jgi:sorting nexin-8